VAAIAAEHGDEEVGVAVARDVGEPHRPARERRRRRRDQDRATAEREPPAAHVFPADDVSSVAEHRRDDDLRRVRDVPDHRAMNSSRLPNGSLA
jgi:hypothetical protein